MAQKGSANVTMDKRLSFGWLYADQNSDAMVGYPILLDCMALAVHDDEYRARETHSTLWAVDSFQKEIQGILAPPYETGPPVVNREVQARMP